MMDIATIKNIFETQFQGIRDKFQDPLVLGIQEARKSNIIKPGVYVIWNKAYEALKVGRSLTNSRTRALQHLAKFTGYKGENAEIMSSLENDPTTKIILFNVKNKEDFHWVAALEIYFELSVQPIIRAKRLA